MKGASHTVVRELRLEDVVPLAAILERAYASPQDFTARLAAYRAMERARPFVAEHDGRPAGIVVGNDYGNAAYVALMGVDPALQRRGVGRALMEALVAWLDERGFAWTELDATPDGAPLYRQYGFGDAGETLVYELGHHGDYGNPARRIGAADRAAVFAFDRAAFGADRSAMLGRLFEDERNASFVEASSGGIEGFAVAQAAGLIGPVIAVSPAAGARLIGSAHAALRGTRRVNVPRSNEDAIAVLAQHAFGMRRALQHMVRGTPAPALRERIFARTNLGQG